MVSLLSKPHMKIPLANQTTPAHSGDVSRNQGERRELWRRRVAQMQKIGYYMKFIFEIG